MLEPLTLWPQERSISVTNFFAKLPGKMYFFFALGHLTLKKGP